MLQPFTGLASVKEDCKCARGITGSLTHLSAVTEDQTHSKLFFQQENPYRTLNTDTQCRDNQPPHGHTGSTDLLSEVLLWQPSCCRAKLICSWLVWTRTTEELIVMLSFS